MSHTKQRFACPFVFALAAVAGLTAGCARLAPPELTEAVERGDLQTLRSLLARGVDVNAREPQLGDTALHTAVSRDGQDEMVRALLAAGADVEARNRSGQTPLMRAARWSPLAMRALIGAGADVRAEDEHGETALMIAAFSDNSEGVKLLLQQGADINHIDRLGETALSAAIKWKHAKMIPLLRSAGAKDRDQMYPKVAARLATAHPWLLIVVLGTCGLALRLLWRRPWVPRLGQPLFMLPMAAMFVSMSWDLVAFDVRYGLVTHDRSSVTMGLVILLFVPLLFVPLIWPSRHQPPSIAILNVAPDDVRRAVKTALTSLNLAFTETTSGFEMAGELLGTALRIQRGTVEVRAPARRDARRLARRLRPALRHALRDVPASGGFAPAAVLLVLTVALCALLYAILIVR